MPGTQSHLTSLVLRKQLLLAESEVNREQLLNEWHSLTNETRELAHRAQFVCASVASVASLGIAGVKTMRELQAARSNGKASWISTLINGMRLGTALWKSFRS